MPHEHNMKAEGLRFAHSDGFTDVCFSAKDGKLISAGDDGYACIWTDGVEDSQMTHSLGESVSCIAVYNEILHAVVAESTLSEFEFPSCSFNRICLKLSDQITHFAPNSSYSTLAVGSSDFKIRLIDRESLSVPLSLQDHQAPVLSVAFSNGREDLLASSSCDSTVRLWSPKEGKCISTFGRVLPRSNDVANSPTLCRLQFSNDSNRLYVPTEGEIKVYDVRNWEKPCDKIDLPKKTHVSSYVRFSPSGNHFAAICKDVLAIYSIGKSQWIARLTHSKPLCAVAWNPLFPNRLAFSDNRGQLGFVSVPVEETITNVNNDVDMIDMDDDAAILAIAAELGDEENSMPGSEKDKLMLSDDEGSVTKVTKHASSKPTGSLLKSDSKKEQLKKFAFSDDEDDFAPLALEDEEKSNGDDPITDLGRIRNEFKEFFDDDDDDDEDGLKEKPAAKASTPTTKPGSVPCYSSNLPTLTKPADSHLQKAFQVHSTPAGRGGQNSRFLVWNQIGVVRLYETESENSVEVEFHDASVHPPISMTSSDEFTLAALTADVLVLSCLAASDDDDDDSETRCRLRVLTLSAWDSSREWLLDLPSGESCLSVAVGSRWIAVVTDKNFVRLFSLAGFQIGILSISGSPVTATGRDDWLAVIFHNGIGARENQNLAFDLYRMGSRTPKLVSSGAVPISPRSTLIWASFGQDLCTLLTSDTSSVVRAYSTSNRTWTPIANLRKCGQIKSRADHYWMVGVSEQQQQIFAIFCKAGTYPAVLPRPILSTVPLGVPLCYATTDTGKLADEAIRLRLFEEAGVQEDNDLKLQETLMRLFAIALKQDRQCRAAEIAESMPTPLAIQLASKYAARLRLGHLSDVLSELAMKRQDEADQQPDEPYFSAEPYSAPIESAYKEDAPVQSLPALATPPVISLVKRTPGVTPSGLAKDFAPPKAVEPAKPSTPDETVDLEVDSNGVGENDGGDVEEVVVEPEPVSKNPFAKAPTSRGNPFRKSTGDVPNSAPKAAASTTGDALSCFEKVEAPRSRATSTGNTTKESSRKKKATDSLKDDGQAAAKKKRSGTKRKSEATPGDERSSSSKSNEADEAEENSRLEKPAAKKAAAKAPNSSTLRKLTDFMFAKND